MREFDSLDSTPPVRPPRLLDQVRARTRVLHYSIRTEEAYVGWIRRFILFHGKRHPSEMGGAEIESFLTSLAVDSKVGNRKGVKVHSTIGP